MAFVAALIAVPIGLLTAIYLSEYAKDGLPARYVGAWICWRRCPPSSSVLFVLALFIYSGFTGHNGLTGRLPWRLSLLPIVGATTEEMLGSCLTACGKPRWPSTPRWR